MSQPETDPTAPAPSTDASLREAVEALCEEWAGGPHGTSCRHAARLREVLAASEADRATAGERVCICPTDDYCPKCHPRWHAKWIAEKQAPGGIGCWRPAYLDATPPADDTSEVE